MRCGSAEEFGEVGDGRVKPKINRYCGGPLSSYNKFPWSSERYGSLNSTALPPNFRSLLPLALFFSSRQTFFSMGPSDSFGGANRLPTVEENIKLKKTDSPKKISQN